MGAKKRKFLLPSIKGKNPISEHEGNSIDSKKSDEHHLPVEANIEILVNHEPIKYDYLQ